MEWDRWEIVRPLGEGGMGRVWLARDRATGALAALKELRDGDSEVARRFLREIDLLGRIDHPNVIRLIGISPDPARPAYAMEFCRAGDLERWLEERRGLGERLDCFGQILAGLEAIHQLMLHRDLKPGNILLGDDGRFRISDFGLGRSLADDTTRITTRSWYSPGFSAPEQQANMREVDQRADLYSAGAILHFMLTGNGCAHGANLTHPAVPRPLRGFLASMLAPNPSDRFASASLARRAFADAAAGIGLEQSPSADDDPFPPSIDGGIHGG